MSSKGDLIGLSNGGIGWLNRGRLNSTISDDASVNIDGASNCGRNRISYSVINSCTTTGGGHDSAGDRRCGGIRLGNAAANIVGINREIALRLNGVTRAVCIVGTITDINLVDIIDSVFVFSRSNGDPATCAWIEAGGNTARIGVDPADFVVSCCGDRQIAGSYEIGAADGCLNVVGNARIVKGTREGTSKLAGGDGHAHRYRQSAIACR